MSRFNLDNFFAALRNLSMRGTQTISSFRGRGSSSVRGCQKEVQRSYDCVDDDARFEPEQKPCEQHQSAKTSRRGRRERTQSQDDSCNFSCRHTQHKPVQEETCECGQQSKPQSCQPEPYEPPCECEPEIPMEMPSGVNVNKQAAINTGIIDGQGNDVYDGDGNDIYAMGNRGIIDTAGNDIYARNYTVNTFNTTNYFPANEPSVEPSVVPSDDPEDPGDPDTTTVDLMPLRNLLNVMDGVTGDIDGIISDKEMSEALGDASATDMDGDTSNISSEERAILNRIKAFNEDKTLISNVIKGDLDNISPTTLDALQQLSDDIKELTKKRNS